MAIVSSTLARHIGHDVHELPVRSVLAKDVFATIHSSMHLSHATWAHGLNSMFAMRSKQIGHSSSFAGSM